MSIRKPSPEEVIGKNPGDLWGGKMPDEFYKKMWHTIKEEKKPFVGKVENVRKDGTSYWQELHISPILDPNGNVQFFIAVEPNITDRKQKEKTRDEFISITGHQLRNPLITIKWLLEWLSQSSHITGEDRKKLEEAYQHNQDLSAFVNDLLALSRAEKVQSMADKETIDLVALVKEITDEVKQANPNVDFSFVSGIEHLPFSISKSMAFQIFSNLVYNAAEYSDKNAGKVDVGFQNADDGYIFSCHNNGPEIKPEDKPHIFSKFFRSPEAVKVKKGGTGLGLFIVKAIADNLGWQVWFESGIGQGTTFYVKIP